MKKAINTALNCWKLDRILLIPIVIFAFMTTVNAQCTLSCEGTVQVSLDSNCEAIITPNIMLSDDGASCPDGQFEIELSNSYGIIPGNKLTAANLGETISARVIDTRDNNNNSCWGNIILEDKLGPAIMYCPDEVDEYCYENSFRHEPIFMDACEGLVEPILLDQDIEDADCQSYSKIITRVYYAKDSGGFESPRCTVRVRIIRMNLNDIQCPQSYLVKDTTSLDCDGTYNARCHAQNFTGLLDYDLNKWTYNTSAGNDIKSPSFQKNISDEYHLMTLQARPFKLPNTSPIKTTMCLDIPCDGDLYFAYRGSLCNKGRVSGYIGYSINGIYTDLIPPANDINGCTSGTDDIALTLKNNDKFCFEMEADGDNFAQSLIVGSISYWGSPVGNPLDKEIWDLDNDGYPDVNEVDVPKLGGVPIYPTPDWLCNAGVFYTDVQLPKIGCVEKVMRVWSIREWWCGNEYEHTCTQIIEIKDLTPPQMACPADMTVTTNTSMAPFETNYHGTVSCGAEIAIPLPPATDRCNATHYTIAYPQGFKENYNGTDLIELPMGRNLVTLTVYDECYNSTECEFYVDVVDNTAPVTICDEFTVVGLTHPGEAHVHASTFDDGSYDDCKLKKTLARRMVTDPTDPPCECDYPEFPDVNYLGEYEGHYYYVSQKEMPGHIAFKLGYAMGGYITTIGDSLENDWITDAVKGYSDDEFMIGLSDAQNEGYFKWQNGEAFDYNNWDKKFSPAIDDGDYVALIKETGTWIDGLEEGDAKYIFELEDPCGFSSYVKFCCADLAQDDHMVIFRTIDSYGNYNDCMVTVEVQDKLIPRITCPKDTIVDCDMAYDINDMKRFGEAFVTENCEVTMTEIVTEDLNQCNTGTIRRTFYATNSTGVQDSCHQYITFVNPDRFVREDITWPDDRLDFPGCDNPDNFGPDVTGRPEFNSDVCDLIGANYEDQVFIFNGEEEAGCFKILRHWTVIDWCQTYIDDDTGLPKFKTWGKQQVIKITNDTIPTIVECQDTVICHYDPDCGNATITLSASATDDCTSDLKWGYSIDYWSNGSYDTISPIFSGVGDANDVTTATLTATLPDGKHRILWQFYDNCGNLESCTENFEIKNCKAPTAYCINGLAVDLMPIDSTGDGIYDFGMVQLWASDFDAGSHHPCTDDIFLSFTADTTDRYMDFDCTTLGDQPVDIYVTIIGANGEFIQSVCETYVNVQDNNNACSGGTSGGNIQSRIAGNIRTEMNEDIEEVRVALDGSDEVEMTNIDGDYAFPDMPMGGAYVVNPLKNDNPLNGVSTLDLVLIQRHILGTQLLDSPYKIIAGDINKDNEISAIDLIELRKLILGIYDDVPNNTSWRFVDESYAFIDATNPLNEYFNEVYNIATLSSDMNIDFLGVKVGDVNNSSVSNILAANSETRNRSSYDLQVKAVKELGTSQLEIPVYAKEDGKLYGMQFTIALHPQTSFNTIMSNQLEIGADNIGLRKEANGLVSFSWNDNNAVSIDKDEPLFTIVLDKNSNELVTYPIDINSELTTSEAYADLNNITTPALNYIMDNEEVETFTLFQNIPNPFRSTTEIRFALPSATNATLTITDVTGKLVKSLNGHFEKGINVIEISSDDLDTNGFLYYTLTTDNNKATMKMVLVK